jgi:adenylate cyclase
VRSLRTDLIEPLAATYGGRLFKTTGDGFLAAFASAVRALRCAVAIQERLNSEPDGLRLRIGVHQGEVVADGDDLLGDGVIIAARLEPLAKPGGICISARVREDAAGKIALEVDDLGTPELKGIAGKVQVLSVRLGTPESPALPLPDKPSIAVLAFTNMSGDPEQEYFSDGLADDLITELSRNASLLVISRHSSFSFRGPAMDVKQIARELGVRYIVEGSVRRIANRVRVNAKLIDAELGSHIWAERYDRALEDVFAVQDEIVSAVTTAINPILDDAEQRRAARKHPESLSAWEAYQRGRAHMLKFDATENAQARAFFERTISLNPGFAPAYSALALTCHYEGSRFATRPLREANEEAQLWALKAVAADPADADAQIMLANVTFLMGDHETALERASRALASPQISPWCIGTAAGIWLNAGRFAEGRELLFTAMRRSPRDPLMPGFLRLLSMSYYLEGDFPRAADSAKRAVAFQPDNPMQYMFRAASLGQLGRIEEARDALRKAMDSGGTFDIYVRERPPWFRPEDHELILDGLRKAGWQG